MVNEEVMKQYKKYELLEGNNRYAKLIHDLNNGGIKSEVVYTYKHREITYFLEKDTALAILCLPGNDILSFVMIDRSFYDKYLVNGKGSFSFVQRNAGDYKVIIYHNGIQDSLHRFILKREELLKEAQVVDHKFHSPLINTLESIRACSHQQNRINSRDTCREGRTTYEEERKNYGEFAYNPLKDYRETWYAYILYKMLHIGTESDLDEYNKDYICRNDENMVRYMQF